MTGYTQDQNALKIVETLQVGYAPISIIYNLSVKVVKRCFYIL